MIDIGLISKGQFTFVIYFNFFPILYCVNLQFIMATFYEEPLPPMWDEVNEDLFILRILDNAYLTDNIIIIFYDTDFYDVFLFSGILIHLSFVLLFSA